MSDATAVVQKPQEGAAVAGVTVTKAKKTGDLIVDLAHRVENIKSATQAKTMAMSMLDNVEYHSFQLGGVLAKIQTEGWFGDHPNFKTFCESELGMTYRKAAYLVEAYHKLVALNVPWEKVASIGWTKLREIMPVLTAENLDAWVEKAKALSRNQLIEMVKSAAVGGLTAAEVEAEAVPHKITTISFKLHEDQAKNIKAAITRAKEASGTEHDNVALDHIATSFLGGAGPANLEELFQTFKAASTEVTEQISPILETFEKVWPSVTLHVEIPD